MYLVAVPGSNAEPCLAFLYSWLTVMANALEARVDQLEPNLDRLWGRVEQTEDRVDRLIISARRSPFRTGKYHSSGGLGRPVDRNMRTKSP